MNLQICKSHTQCISLGKYIAMWQGTAEVGNKISVPSLDFEGLPEQSSTHPSASQSSTFTYFALQPNFNPCYIPVCHSFLQQCFPVCLQKFFSHLHPSKPAYVELPLQRPPRSSQVKLIFYPYSHFIFCLLLFSCEAILNPFATPGTVACQFMGFPRQEY